MDNLLSYCGLADAKIRASDKDLPVPILFKPSRAEIYQIFSVVFCKIADFHKYILTLSDLLKMRNWTVENR